ncbi:MAG TPA: hypothetical protein VF820_01075 [Patescibacteria group bacterium]
MNLGFDLDGIFVDKPPFMPKWLIEKLYKAKDTTVLEYRIPGNFEQKIRKISHISILRPAIKNNIVLLAELAKNKNNNLFLVSSRFNFLRNATEHIEEKYNFSTIFKKMVFNAKNEQPHIFKNRLIKELHIDRFVDDDLSLLFFLAKENPQTKFYWLNNKETKSLSQNLFAITNLLSIIK